MCLSFRWTRLIQWKNPEVNFNREQYLNKALVVLLNGLLNCLRNNGPKLYYWKPLISLVTDVVLESDHGKMLEEIVKNKSSFIEFFWPFQYLNRRLRLFWKSQASLLLLWKFLVNRRPSVQWKCLKRQVSTAVIVTGIVTRFFVKRRLRGWQIDYFLSHAYILPAGCYR